MIFLAGANETLDPNLSLHDRFMHIGYNTGNMAISRGLRDILSRRYGFNITRYTPSATVQDEDVLFVGAANWIAKSVDLNWFFAPGIERFKKVFVVGLGIQSDIVSIDEVSESAKSFLSFLTDRIHGIGVRDKRSKDLLERVTPNVWWTGCPSLRIRYTPEESNRNGRVYCGSSEVIAHAHEPSKLRAHEFDVISQVLNGDSDYVLQAELGLMEAVERVDSSAFSNCLKSTLGEGLEVERDNWKHQFRFFFSVDDWMSYLSTKESTFGSRLHGNILAWKAGCLPFLVAHDARTKAFIEDFHFPGCTVEALSDAGGIHHAIFGQSSDRFEHALEETGFNLERLLLLAD